MNNLTIALLLITFTQVVTYLQLQSQFFWEWSKNNTLLVSLIGVPISMLLIMYTKYCADAFNGEVWPGRLIGFAIGAIVFALCSKIFLNEAMTAKTVICLILATIILTIQIFWK